MQLNSRSVGTFLATKELFCNVICRHLFPCFHLLLCCEKMCLSGRLSLLLEFGKNYLFFWKLSHFFLVSCLVRTLENSGLVLSCHHAPTLDSSPFKAAKTSCTCYINYMLHTAVDRYIKNTGDKWTLGPGILVDVHCLADPPEYCFKMKQTPDGLQELVHPIQFYLIWIFWIIHHISPAFPRKMLQCSSTYFLPWNPV